MNKARVFTIVPMLALCATMVACDKKPDIDPAIAKKAEQVWTTRCVTCHGKDGKGNGPGAMALNPKPRSFTQPKWQASVDDQRIAKVIVEGGVANGLSAGMAPNPDLKDQPQVVDALVKKIRKMVK